MESRNGGQHRSMWILLVGGALVACSSSSGPADAPDAESGATGSGSADGTVGGASFAIDDAFAFLDTIASETQTNYVVNINLASKAGICAFRADYPAASPKNTTFVGVQILSAGSPPAAGTYSLFPADAGDLMVGSPGALGTILSFDAACNVQQIMATAGTVTLTSVDNGNYAGTYSLTFPSGTLSGEFNAPSCTTGDAGDEQDLGQCM